MPTGTGTSTSSSGSAASTPTEVFSKNSILRSKSLTFTDSTLTIELPDVSTIFDGDNIRFIITEKAPKDTTLSAKTVIKINGQEIPLRCKLGKEISPQQLKTRFIYTAKIATSVPQFLLLNNITPPTDIQPVISPQSSSGSAS